MHIPLSRTHLSMEEGIIAVAVMVTVEGSVTVTVTVFGKYYRCRGKTV